MAFTRIAHTATNTTSPAVDTTGAKLIVIGAEQLSGGGRTFTAPSDNKGNTYVPLTPSSIGSGANALIYYCKNPIVSSGSADHTFTNNMTEFGVQGFFSCISVAAFDTADTSSPFDQENQGGAVTGGQTTAQPGSVTPSAVNELVVTVVANDGTKTFTINGSYTTSDIGTATGGNTVCLAWDVQTSATPTNPTWTLNSASSSPFGATIASFKAGSSPPPPPPPGGTIAWWTWTNSMMAGLGRN